MQGSPDALRLAFLLHRTIVDSLQVEARPRFCRTSTFFLFFKELIMDIESMFSQARELARQGDRPGARRILEEILQEQPDNEDVLLWHALVAPTKGEVMNGLQKVLEINPNNAQAQQRLAKLKASSGTPASTPSNSTPFLYEPVKSPEPVSDAPAAFTTPDPVAAVAAYAVPSTPVEPPHAAGNSNAALIKRLDHLIALQEHTSQQVDKINRVAQFFFWLVIIGLVLGALAVVLSVVGALSLMNF